MSSPLVPVPVLTGVALFKLMLGAKWKIMEMGFVVVLECCGLAEAVGLVQTGCIPGSGSPPSLWTQHWIIADSREHTAMAVV